MKMIKRLILLVFTALNLALYAHADNEVLLAEVADKNIEPSAYLVSEKLDGVRAIWDGRVLRFRSGNIVPTPAWFTKALPKTPLDGELWLERGQFEALSGIVRTSPANDADWRKVGYWVYELPNAAGSFADRYQRLQQIVTAAKFPQLHLVEQRAIASNPQLHAWLDAVVHAGGEGLMLHLASAPYETGRQDVLLKLKPVLDAEAKVIGYRPGKGKFTGMLGSLELETDEGIRFRLGVGFKNADRLNPPPVGSRVTFTYRGLTKNGVPRFASFFRVRVDL